MANELDLARAQLQCTVAECLLPAIHGFHTATGKFPRSITVQLGELVHVNNVETPRITVKVE